MPGLAGEVANLIVALKLDDRGFSGKLNGIARQLKGMDAGLSQMGRGAGQLGRGLGQLADRAVIAGAGLGTFAVTTAASFEQAFTGIEKTVDETVNTTFAELEQTVRDMANTMPLAFEELAAIGEAGGALGVGADSLEDFIDVVARLSVSTNLSSDQAATALGQLGTILDLTGDDYREFADTLVALGNAGASTEDQIVEMAARFAAAGNSAGLTNDEILTLSSAVASMGVEVEAGGSSLSRLFNNTTTNIGVANEKANEFAEALGLTFDQFKEAWRTDALGTFEDLLGKLNELDKFEGAELLKSIGITNTRDVNTILLMAQNMDFLAEQTAVAAESTGSLNEESDKFFATTQGQWQILQNNVRDAAATIGAELLPVVNEVMQEFVSWLQEPGTQQGLKTFAEDLAEGVRNLVREIKGADFGPLIDTMKGAAAVARGAFDAFNALPGPIKQLALAAIIGNKVTGGAVGSIAAGLGNILMGGLKLAIPALSRGMTPANPLFTKEVGLGGVGGVGGVGGAGGGLGGLLGNALRIGVPALLAAELARTFEPLVQDLSEQVHDNLGLDEDWNPFKGAGPDDWQWPLGSKNPPKWLPDWLGGPPEIPEGLKAFSPNLKDRAVGGSFADDISASDASDADSVLLAQFGGKLDKLATNEVIQHLERTNEIGLEGVGTSFQVGIKDGLDPIGDVATRILERAENPKDPAVMREIKGHIAGLEEIQATYLATGDVPLARKVQDNIDTLHALIGTTDTSNAIAERAKAEAAQADAAMLSSSRYHAGLTEGIKGLQSIGNSKLDGIKMLESINSGKLSGILTKKTSVTVKTDVYTTVKVSATIVKQQVDSISSSISGGSSGGQVIL